MQLSQFLFILILSLITGQVWAEEPLSVPGEVVVKFKPGAINSSRLQSLSSQYHFQVKRVIPDSDFVVVKFPKSQTGFELSMAQELMTSEDIEVAEPNYLYYLQQTPNDPDYSKLWGLENTGNNDRNSPGRAGVDIAASKAWDIQTGNKDLVVAVIDTGVDYKHEDLKDNMWVNQAEKDGKAGVDDDNNGYVDDIYGYDFYNKDSDPLDDHGHGSHCSGTIGAKGNNGVGITGINWNIKIMAVKIFSSGGTGGPLDSVLEAIRYATKMGARISNNSWGGGPYSELLEGTIRDAGTKGLLFVAAAGNDHTDNDSKPKYPASYNLPNIISVAAVNNMGNRASFSNYGRKTVHVAAPGEDIYSIYPGSDATTGYGLMSGTSMATPHVTGIAALLLSNEPNLTPEEIRARLIATSTPVTGLNRVSVSKGIVNAYNALTNFKAPPDLNDPTNWELNKELNISTEHPYQDNSVKTWEVEVPYAKQISLYFEKFKTEENFDKVTITDRKGTVVAVFTGTLNDLWTDPIEGNYAKITFTPDKTKNDYGFDLKKVVYR